MSSVSYRKVRNFFAPTAVRKPKRRFSAAEKVAFDAHGWRCHYCGSNHALVADHKVPRAHGGTDEATNLIPACWACNSAKGKKSYDEFVEWMAAELAAFSTSYLEGHDW